MTVVVANWLRRSQFTIKASTRGSCEVSTLTCICQLPSRLSTSGAKIIRPSFARSRADIDGVCRQLEISVQTYQRWRSQYKAMRPEDVVRLKRLEKENARLKRLLAEKELDNDMLREVARGNW